MSVINRMLQELESRHEAPQGRLPGIVRAVPPPAASRRLPLLAAIVVVLLGGAGVLAWQLLSVRPATSAAAPPVAQIVTSAASPITPLAAPPRPAPEAAASVPTPPEPLRLQTPTERLVSETALAPRPVAQAAVHATRRTAQAEPVPPPSSPREAKPVPTQNSDAPVIIKSAPNTLPETADVGGMKQISPTQRADHQYREALALIAQGRMGEAQAMLEEALKLDPRHLGARQALLGMLVDGGHLGQAERLLQDGLALGVAPPNLAMALARLQMERGDQNAALATLERYLPQGRGDPDYEAFFAALLQRAARDEDAVGHYQAALRAQPGRAVWWMGLGMSLQALKRAPEAEQAFVRAHALPGLTPALRAFVEQRLKQLQQPREPGAAR